MNHDPSHLEILRELLSGQLLGVLGTHHDGEPYTSLVGFAATPDLRQLLFATGRATRKHANLVADARASMLVDNRTNRPADFTEAAAATAVGVVEEISTDDRTLFEEVFLAKHPHLESFRSLAELRPAPSSGLGLHGRHPLPARHRAPLRLMALVVDLGAARGDATRAWSAARARRWRRWLAHGVSVPPTLCLTTQAYELFVDAASLRPVIRQELGRKHFADMRWEEIWDTALRIRNRFLRASVPQAVEAELAERLAGEFASGPLAVRSSAPGEDAEGASFAGLHDSFVGIRGIDEVVDAVRSVWASLWTDRALLYRRELGIDPDSSSMAVVIQRLVEGEVSGIAFGVHPTGPGAHGRRGGSRAQPGPRRRHHRARPLGDRRRDRRDRRAPPTRDPPSARARRRRPRDRGAWQRLPPPLDAHRLDEIIGPLSAATEALFGSPQDVEWTIDRVRLVLLQSRPVTTATTDGDDKRAWYLSLTRSLDNLRGLRRRVEDELLPAMDREADDIARRDLDALDNHELAAEIENRRRHPRPVGRCLLAGVHPVRARHPPLRPVLQRGRPAGRPARVHDSPRRDPHAEPAAQPPTRRARRPRPRGPGAPRVARGTARSATRSSTPISRPFSANSATRSTPTGRASTTAARLVRLLLAMAASPPESAQAFDADDVARMTETFLASVPAERRGVGRGDPRSRAQQLSAPRRRQHPPRAAQGARHRRRRGGPPRLADARPPTAGPADPDQVIAALRHPNLVVEPPPQTMALETEERLRPQPQAARRAAGRARCRHRRGEADRGGRRPLRHSRRARCSSATPSSPT